MQKNKTFIIIALLLTALAIYLIINRSNTTLNIEKTSFAVSDTASIDKIFLADKGGHTVTLERQQSGEWLVNGSFDARPDAVSNLLATIMKVEMKAPVGINARENIIKDLAARGIKTEIYQNGKLKKTYYVGGPTPDNFGTYMALEENGKISDPYITHIPGFYGYLTTRYIVHDYKWRSTGLFKTPYTGIKKLKMEYFQKPDDSFEITKDENGKLQVTSLKYNAPLSSFDSMAVKEYLTLYSNVHFEAFEKFKPETRDSIFSSPPYFRISLTDNKDKTNTVTAFRIKTLPGALDINGNPIEYDLDRMYAKINDEQDVALIQYFTFDNLLKPLKWFETDPVQPKRLPRKAD